MKKSKSNNSEIKMESLIDIIKIEDGRIIISNNQYRFLEFGPLGCLMCVFLGITLFINLSLILDNFQNLELVTVLSVISIFIFILLLGIKVHYVVDYKNNMIYKKINFFPIKYDLIKASEIHTICNNIHGYLSRRKHSNSTMNPTTKLIHDFYVSIFLKNGKLIDFIFLGDSDNNYEKSVELVKLISKYLEKPSLICENYQCIRVENNKNVFYLNTDKVELEPLNKKIIVTGIVIIIIYILIETVKFFR